MATGAFVLSDDGTTCGSTARGMRSRSSMKSSHSALAMFSSSVRLALETSVTCRSPCDSFHTSQLSIVPKASSPFSARWRAPGTCSSSQASLVPEK